jgi:hypothetical protein
MGCVTGILGLVTEVGKQEIPLRWRFNAMVVGLKPVRMITRKHWNKERETVMIFLVTDSVFFGYVCPFLTRQASSEKAITTFYTSNTLPESIPKQAMCYVIPVASHLSLRFVLRCIRSSSQGMLLFPATAFRSSLGLIFFNVSEMGFGRQMVLSECHHEQI